LIATSLVDFLADTSHKEKPTFFAAITLGTIFFVSKSTRNFFQLSNEPKVAAAVAALKTATNKAILEAAQDLSEAFYSEAPLSAFSNWQ
jgi:uncharacterized protein YpmB